MSSNPTSSVIHDIEILTILLAYNAQKAASIPELETNPPLVVCLANTITNLSRHNLVMTILEEAEDKIQQKKARIKQLTKIARKTSRKGRQNALIEAEKLLGEIAELSELLDNG